MGRHIEIKEHDVIDSETIKWNTHNLYIMDYGERIDVESILVSRTWVVDSAINQTLAFYILREKFRMNRLRETDILHVRHRYVWPATEQRFAGREGRTGKKGRRLLFYPFWTPAEPRQKPSRLSIPRVAIPTFHPAWGCGLQWTSLLQPILV